MRITVLLFLLINCFYSYGQHCPPIYISKIDSISLKHQGKDLHIQFDYLKFGGQYMPDYQIYLVAYLDKTEEIANELCEREKGFRTIPCHIYNREVMTILKRDILSCNVGKYDLKEEAYRYSYTLDIPMDDMVDKLSILAPTIEGNYFKIAIFIPYLDDDKHTIDVPLPSNTHECIYGKEAFLFFSPLPYQFSVNIVDKIKGSRHYIEIDYIKD